MEQTSQNKLPKLNNLPRIHPPVWKRMKKDEFTALIYKYYGMTSLLVKELDAPFTQIWSAIKKWNLEKDLEEAKRQWRDKAETTLLNALDSENENIRVKAAEIALKVGQPQIQQQINILSDNDKKLQLQNIFGS